MLNELSWNLVSLESIAEGNPIASFKGFKSSSEKPLISTFETDLYGIQVWLGDDNALLSLPTWKYKIMEPDLHMTSKLSLIRQVLLENITIWLSKVQILTKKKKVQIAFWRQVGRKIPCAQAF